MTIIVFFAAQAGLLNSLHALGLENDALRQVRIGALETALTKQCVEFVVMNFAHRMLTY